MKKMLVSMIAVSAIAMNASNAAITKETCQKSNKYIWAEAVKNADGSKGACIQKDACNSAAYQRDFCVQAYRDLSVCSDEDAKRLMSLYAKNILNWKKGCESFTINSVGSQIGCYSNGNYMAFEFDKTNEGSCYVGDNSIKVGICIAFDGKPGEEPLSMPKLAVPLGSPNPMVLQPIIYPDKCYGLNKKTCVKITGDERYYNEAETSCDLEDVSVENLIRHGLL